MISSSSYESSVVVSAEHRHIYGWLASQITDRITQKCLTAGMECNIAFEMILLISLCAQKHYRVLFDIIESVYTSRFCEKLKIFN